MNRSGAWSLVVAAGIAITFSACGRSSSLGTPPADFEAGLYYGPVIGSVTPTRTTVRWRLSSGGGGAVDIRALGGSWRRVPSGAPGLEHEIVVDALLPATEYEYRLVKDGAPLQRTYRFTTAPDDPEAPVRIAVIGDMGCGCANQAALIERIAVNAPDLVLLTGDIAYDGGSEWEVRARFLVPFADLLARIPHYAALGNHDATTLKGEPLLNALPLPRNDEEGGEQYYAFRWGCARILALNAEYGMDSATAPQLRWLERTLAQGGAPWTLAFAHRPVYAASGQDDNLTLQAFVVPLFEAYGLDLYLSGHLHNYQRTHPMRDHQPIPVPGETITDPGVPAYIVTGGGGRSLYSVVSTDPRFATTESVYHITLLDVTPTELRVRPVRIDGSVIEDVRYVKPVR